VDGPSEMAVNEAEVGLNGRSFFQLNSGLWNDIVVATAIQN